MLVVDVPAPAALMHVLVALRADAVPVRDVPRAAGAPGRLARARVWLDVERVQANRNRDDAVDGDWKRDLGFRRVGVHLTHGETRPDLNRFRNLFDGSRDRRVFARGFKRGFKHREARFRRERERQLRLERGDVRAVRVGGDEDAEAPHARRAAARVRGARRQRDGAYGRRRAQARGDGAVRVPHVGAERLEAVRRERIVRARNPRTRSPPGAERGGARVRLQYERVVGEPQVRGLRGLRGGLDIARIPRAERGVRGGVGVRLERPKAPRQRVRERVHDPGRLREHFSEILAERGRAGGTGGRVFGGRRRLGEPSRERKRLARARAERRQAGKRLERRARHLAPNARAARGRAPRRARHRARGGARRV